MYQVRRILDQVARHRVNYRYFPAKALIPAQAFREISEATEKERKAANVVFVNGKLSLTVYDNEATASIPLEVGSVPDTTLYRDLTQFNK